MEHRQGTGIERSPSAAGLPGRRRRLRRAAVTVFILAAPVAALAWFAADTVAGRELERADTRLQTALRVAGTELALTISSADGDARRLARTPALQRAVIGQDRAAAARLARVTPGLAVYAGGRRLTGPLDGDAFVRTVAVLGPSGRRLGRVGVAVPLDEAFLLRLQRRASAPLVLEREGEITVGPEDAMGLGLEVAGVTPQTTSIGSDRYRAVAAPLPGGHGRLVALVQAGSMEAAARNKLILVGLAALATLCALVIAADALLPIIRRQLGRRPAAEEEESVELLGSALASAHDAAALLPVILETAVEVTGAVGGVLRERRVEIARTGEIPPLAEPLRLQLAGRNGSKVVALLYPPFGGFSATERSRGERFAAQASVALENARQHAIARRQAATDPLTGLANRRRFMEQLTWEAKRRARSGRPVALIVADLDDFKLVNDRHGHDTGDLVLRAFADVLTGTVREIDVAARLGGEEFAVLLRETDGAGAAVLAARLRERLERLEVPAPGGGSLTVTASFGCTSSPPVERVEDLPAVADRALYAAKHGGKNRVVEAVGL